ncbi:alpha/beta hydrolase family protein [Alcaligenes sp.]|uniref:alpha/beta hydrolase family protein n=1 Tax=Alcaligenes sp. TaxID=512 RepID=UPI003D01F934
MHPLKLVLAAALSFTTIVAHAAGFHRIEIPAESDSPALKGAVWYPCSQPLEEVKIGPYVMSVAKDCPVVGRHLPLVVISHGWGGTFLGHWGIAETLANAGFVVAAINHGDNALNPRRYGDLSVLIERPTDIRRLIDFMLDSWPDASKLDAQRVGFFGFSRGGYTGLVSIGANPLGELLCKHKDNPACEQAKQGELLTLTHDPRIKAAVVADPLSDFFTVESFKNVKVPVQLWRSEQGGDGVTPESVAAIAHALSERVEFHTVAAAEHFAFLAPCTPEMAKRAPEICSDPPGFDRQVFHTELNSTVLAFFRKNLANDEKPVP